MNRLRRVASVALVAPLLFGFASCAEDEPVPKMPDPTAEPTTSETATETPEPKEPWEEKSYAGAEAFAEHWFDVFSEAMPTGDTTEMRAISDPECVNCNIVIEQLEGYYEAGGFFRSKGWEVTKATSLKSRPIAEPLVGMTIVTHPERFKESAEAKVMRNGASEQAYSAELRWAHGAWLMTKFEPVS